MWFMRRAGDFLHWNRTKAAFETRLCEGTALNEVIPAYWKESRSEVGDADDDKACRFDSTQSLSGLSHANEWICSRRQKQLECREPMKLTIFGQRKA